MNDIKRIYERAAETHGVGSSAGLGWSDKSVQVLRLDVILGEIGEYPYLGKLGETQHSMIDVGCGVGDIVSRPAFPIIKSYTGVDLVQSNIEQARKTYMKRMGCRFYQGDFLDLPLAPADFVVASGTFAYYTNAKMFDVLRKMWGLTNILMAFNVRVAGPNDSVTAQGISGLGALDTVLGYLEVDRYKIDRSYLPNDVTVFCYKWQER